MPELLTFQQFNDLALAEQLVEILKANNIPFLLETGPPVFNPSFSMNFELTAQYLVKIPPDDFERAEQCVRAYERQFVDEVAADHYLFTFTNAELLDVLAKPDEWSALDVELSKKILAERGQPVDAATEQELREERLDDLKQEEQSPMIWLAIGYASALAGAMLSLYLWTLGLFIGWYLMSAKKTLPNGERTYIFKKGDRLHGRIMLVLSVLGFIGGVVYYSLR